MIIYDILYKRGEHEGKESWLKCGALLEKEGGKRSIKIDMMPVGPEWNCWLVVSERKERDAREGVCMVSLGEDVPF
jgi:hypothetical protein